MSESTTKKKWTKFAEKHLLHRTIVGVRYMTEAECDVFDWDKSAIVLVLDNGVVVYPSRDDEGNNAGALFGQAKSGKQLIFPVI